MNQRRLAAEAVDAGRRRVADRRRDSRALARDLGILLFVGETGRVAGQALQSGLSARASLLFGAGMVVNVVTMLVALAFARVVLRMQRVDAWGGPLRRPDLDGGPACGAPRRGQQRAGHIVCATAYAVRSVLATVAGLVVVLSLNG